MLPAEGHTIFAISTYNLGEYLRSHKFMGCPHRYDHGLKINTIQETNLRISSSREVNNDCGGQETTIQQRRSLLLRFFGRNFLLSLNVNYTFTHGF